MPFPKEPIRDAHDPGRTHMFPRYGHVIGAWQSIPRDGSMGWQRIGGGLRIRNPMQSVECQVLLECDDRPCSTERAGIHT
jgi:hypothetical protein